MTTSCTDWDHPLYNKKFWAKDYINLFMKNPEKMAFVSLGEMLDFISLGGGNFVAYEMNTPQLIKIIRRWMRHQNPKIEFKEIPVSENCYTLEEKRREYNYMWNRFEYDMEEELPRINYNECPRDKNHKGLVKDLGGRIRCSHTTKKLLRPNYTEEYESIDIFSETTKKDFWENEPSIPTPDEWEDEEGNYIDWSEEYDEYLGEKEKFEEEEPTLLVSETCYAIIKESSDLYFPLETILDRLNYHSRDSKTTIHPFSGFTLANFVKAWWKQPGRKKVWRKEGEFNLYRHFKDFRPWSSGE